MWNSTNRSARKVITIIREKKKFILYRDDSLATVSSGSGPVLDRMRMGIISLFKNEGPPMAIEINLIKADF